MNSKERKEIDASVSKVSSPISKSTLLGFILGKKLRPSAQMRTEISWYLHCWNSTKPATWNIELQHFCAGAQQPGGTMAKSPSLQKLSECDTEKLLLWTPSLKQGWVPNVKGEEKQRRHTRASRSIYTERLHIYSYVCCVHSRRSRRLSKGALQYRIRVTVCRPQVCCSIWQVF